MKKYKWILIVLNLSLLLLYINYATGQKERILKNGQLILLELAPVDPRSLMQGDYMDLRYAMANDAFEDDAPRKRGYCVVKLDERGIAKKQRLQRGTTPVYEGEYLIEYTGSNWSIRIGAESYFFQEGHAEKYENAKYGGLKVDAQGHSVLIGLYNDSLRQIQ